MRNLVLRNSPTAFAGLAATEQSDDGVERHSEFWKDGLASGSVCGCWVRIERARKFVIRAPFVDSHRESRRQD
ncbi:MAG: hypothetical protein DWI22_05190 [Planctomycetota bacterium]|nr:MAG: hypothetical protein DWI22_05190 [Planctomycetota bacterium]